MYGAATTIYLRSMGLERVVEYNNIFNQDRSMTS